MNKSISLFEYVQLFFKWYSEISKKIQEAPVYRLLDVTNNSSVCCLKIQIIGRSTIFECQPLDIVNNDAFLEGFSKKDVRIITYFATKELNKPKFKIFTQETQQTIDRIIFKLFKKDSKEIIKKTAREISLDKNILNQLSQEDAHLIGYVTANEQENFDREQMEILKGKKHN